MPTPTPRWLDRARSDNTIARVIQTLVDAGYEPADARRLVLEAAKEPAR